jgi:hypothetical protein
MLYLLTATVLLLSISSTGAKKYANPKEDSPMLSALSGERRVRDTTTSIQPTQNQHFKSHPLSLCQSGICVMKKNSKDYTKTKRRHIISVHSEDVAYDDVSKVFRASNVSNFDLVAEEMDIKPAEEWLMANKDMSEQNDFKGTDYEFWQTKLEQLQQESHRSGVKRDTESVNKKKNSFKGLSRDLITPTGKGPSEYTLKIDNGIMSLRAEDSSLVVSVMEKASSQNESGLSIRQESSKNFHWTASGEFGQEIRKGLHRNALREFGQDVGKGFHWTTLKVKNFFKWKKGKIVDPVVGCLRDDKCLETILKIHGLVLGKSFSILTLSMMARMTAFMLFGIKALG